MIVNLKTMLDMAAQQNCAIGSFNVYNLESVLAVYEAMQETKCPAIISFGESYMKHAPIEAVAACVKALLDDSELTAVLHLDHAKNLSSIERAIDCGFSSVMYDGSRLPLERNIADTQKAVQMAHDKGVSVEGELGYLNEEDGSGRISAQCTGVDEARQYVQQTDVDALAVAVGNAHGIYFEKPKLHFEQLQRIAQAVPCPLVLHGSSGISSADLARAIDCGVRKFNVNTEISTTAVAEARHFLAEHPAAENPNLRFETVLKDARSSMKNKIEEFMQVFSRKSLK